MNVSNILENEQMSLASRIAPPQENPFITSMTSLACGHQYKLEAPANGYHDHDHKLEAPANGLVLNPGGTHGK